MEGNVCDWIFSLLCDAGGEGVKGLLRLCHHHSRCPKLAGGPLGKSKAGQMGKEVYGETVTPSQKSIAVPQEKQYSLKLWTFSAAILCVVQTPKEKVVGDINVAPPKLPHQEQREEENHKEIWC